MIFLRAFASLDALDLAGLLLFILVFPVYHLSYPLLMKVFPNQAARVRFDKLRRSWIQGIVDRREIVVAAQQTRNLTMVATLLGSSSLILMGVTANILVGHISRQDPDTRMPAWEPEAQLLAIKLLLVIAVFGVAFAYCMTSLRNLGHFNLVIGADPDLIDELEGSAVDYHTALINRASTRYTLAVRTLYSSSPLFMWLFDTWLMIVVSLFWAVKFVGFQDFAHVLRRGKRRAKGEAVPSSDTGVPV